MRQVAVVTGGAIGLGRDICVSLSKRDYDVVVHYNKNKNKAENLVEELVRNGSNSFAISADLVKRPKAYGLFNEVIEKYGKVDLLVNNVGNFLYKEFSKTSDSEFIDIYQTNLFASLYCSRAVLPSMRKAKYGNIINIGAVGAQNLVIRKQSAPYYMAKNSLFWLTKIMAWEEAKYGLRINMISPASMKEDIFKSEDFPMGRAARYSDVASAFKFLTSEEAYYINGANIEVAGAFVLGIGK